MSSRGEDTGPRVELEKLAHSGVGIYSKLFMSSNENEETPGKIPYIYMIDKPPAIPILPPTVLNITSYASRGKYRNITSMPILVSLLTYPG